MSRCCSLKAYEKGEEEDAISDRFHVSMRESIPINSIVGKFASCPEHDNE
jgi:hypothetical protein